MEQASDEQEADRWWSDPWIDGSAAETLQENPREGTRLYWRCYRHSPTKKKRKIRCGTTSVPPTPTLGGGGSGDISYMAHLEQILQIIQIIPNGWSRSFREIDPSLICITYSSSCCSVGAVQSAWLSVNIARYSWVGSFTMEMLHKCISYNGRWEARLVDHDVSVNDIYYIYHHPICIICQHSTFFLGWILCYVDTAQIRIL